MLHHSCARCREKKIRCDGKAPCNHCISCEVASECKRLQRKQRRRKADVPAITTSVGKSKFSGPAGHGNKTMPSPLESSLGSSSGSPSHSQRSNVAGGTPQSSLRPPPSTASEHSETPSAMFDFSGLHNSSDRSNTSTALSPSSTCNITTTSQMGVSEEQLSLWDQARRVIGEHDAAGNMIDFLFYYRCSTVVNSCVHVPSLKSTLGRLFYCPASAAASTSGSIESVVEAELALLLMALAMSIQFAPRGANEESQMFLIQALGPDLTPIERQHALHSLAKVILQRLVFSSNASLAQVQACILMVVYDLDDAGFKEGMLWNAVRCAEQLRMDHIGSAEEVTVESEMRVRAWWFLVCRDWFTAPKKGSYRINAAHFTTRLPLIISDENLQQITPGTIASEAMQERNAALWLPVRWTLPLIDMASLVKQLVDEKLSNRSNFLSFAKVEQSFVALIERLPAGFRLDETYTYGASSGWPPCAFQQRYSIERWLLHQIIFATMLEFYEVPQRIGEAVSPTMVALANHILDLQSRLRHRCDVVDTLKVNVDGIVRAAILICTDLMYKSSTDGVKAGNGLVRQITLGRVREAVLRCQTSKSMRGDLGIIEGLLEAEERCWRQQMGQETVASGGTYTPSSIQPNPAPASTTAPLSSIWSAASLAMAADLPAFGPEGAKSVHDGPLFIADNSDMSSFPSDGGICSALQADSDVVDKLWAGVMAFLDKPIPTFDPIS